MEPLWCAADLAVVHGKGRLLASQQWEVCLTMNNLIGRTLCNTYHFCSLCYISTGKCASYSLTLSVNLGKLTVQGLFTCTLHSWLIHGFVYIFRSFSKVSSFSNLFVFFTDHSSVLESVAWLRGSARKRGYIPWNAANQKERPGAVQHAGQNLFQSSQAYCAESQWHSI